VITGPSGTIEADAPTWCIEVVCFRALDSAVSL